MDSEHLLLAELKRNKENLDKRLSEKEAECIILRSERNAVALTIGLLERSFTDHASVAS